MIIQKIKCHFLRQKYLTGISDDDDIEMLTSIFMEEDEDNDEDEDDNTGRHGGSKPDKAANIDRDIQAGAKRIFDDYFSATNNLMTDYSVDDSECDADCISKLYGVSAKKMPFLNNRVMQLGNLGTPRSRKV